MKTKILSLLTMLFIQFFGNPAFTQSGEFEVYDNGLIYSEQTMDQLEHIVDSLNLEFKQCDLSKIYYSKAQTKGHLILLDTGNIVSAREDMEAGMPIEQFIKKYPEAEVNRELLVVKYPYEGKVSFHHIPADGGYDVQIQKENHFYDEPMAGKWVYRYNEKSSYSDEYIRGFYFPDSFESIPLKESYAHLIQYVDCMIDTNTTIFLTEMEEDGNEKKGQRKVGDFLKYLNKQLNNPVLSYEEWEKLSEKEREVHQEKLKSWESNRIELAKQLLAEEEKLDRLLKTAVVATLEHGGSSEEFEYYVEHLYSKAVALEMKRNRRVFGFCSQDVSPRLHAVDIARLSAETINWNVFLRAHLNIMNDRFDRASDGSYAWASRSTYIRELEELDIVVPDLLIGMSLRVENPSQNHYYGSIRRIGRALSETQNTEEVESALQKMMEDEELDDYNRLLAYFLFANYHYYTEEGPRREAVEARLQKAIKGLPDYLTEELEKK